MFHGSSLRSIQQVVNFFLNNSCMLASHYNFQANILRWMIGYGSFTRYVLCVIVYGVKTNMGPGLEDTRLFLFV